MVERKVSFAAGTKPGATGPNLRSIYDKGRLQGCVEGGRTMRKRKTARHNRREPMRNTQYTGWGARKPRGRGTETNGWSTWTTERKTPHETTNDEELDITL